MANLAGTEPLDRLRVLLLMVSFNRIKVFLKFRVLKSLQAEAKAVAEEAARLQPPSTSKAMTQQLQVAAPAISQQPAAATSAMASQTGSAAASTNSDDRVPNTESAAATDPVSVSCRTTTAVDQGVQSPAVVQGVQSAAVEQGVQTVTAAATVQPVTIQSSPAQTKLPEEGLNSAMQVFYFPQHCPSGRPKQLHICVYFGIKLLQRFIFRPSRLGSRSSLKLRPLRRASWRLAGKQVWRRGPGLRLPQLL